MAIGLYEAALYLAYALQKDAGDNDIALALDAGMGKVKAAGQADARTANEARTACINLFQAGTKNCQTIVTTTVPTQACRGMAINLGMHGSYTFYFYRNGVLRRLSAPNSGGSWSEENAPNTGPALVFDPIAGFAALSEAARRDRAKIWVAATKLVAPVVGKQNINFQTSLSIVPAKRRVGPVYSVPPTVQAVEAPDTPWLRHLYMALVYAIAAKCFSTYGSTRDKSDPELGNNIASLLVGPDNQILAWGRNKGASHATWHGETGLIQAYQDRSGGAKLKAGSRLFTTLEPCFMCAGVITHSGSGIKVYYGHKDPGISDSSLAKGHNSCSQEHMPTIQSMGIERGHMKVPTPLLPSARRPEYDETLSHLGVHFFDTAQGGVTPYLAGGTAKSQFDNSPAVYARLEPTDKASPEYKIWKAGADLLAIVS